MIICGSSLKIMIDVHFWKQSIFDSKNRWKHYWRNSSTGDSNSSTGGQYNSIVVTACTSKIIANVFIVD
ncbi:hypothetical protein Tco_0581674 [Tanacetum coccineum]